MIRIDVGEVLAMPVVQGTCELNIASEGKVVLHAGALTISSAMCVVRKSFMVPRTIKSAVQVTLTIQAPGQPPIVVESAVRPAALLSLTNAGELRRIPLTSPKVATRMALQLRVHHLASSLDDIDAGDIPLVGRDAQYERLLAALDRSIAERGLRHSQNAVAVSPQPQRRGDTVAADASASNSVAAKESANSPTAAVAQIAEPESNPEDFVTLRWTGTASAEVSAVAVQPGAIVLPGMLLMELCTYSDADGDEAGAADQNEDGTASAIQYSAYGIDDSGGGGGGGYGDHAGYGDGERSNYSQVEFDDDDNDNNGDQEGAAVDVSRYTRLAMDGPGPGSPAPLRTARALAPLHRIVTRIVWESTKPGIVTDVHGDLHHLLDPNARLLTVDTSPRHHQLIYLRAADRAAGLSRMATSNFGINDQFQRMSEDLARSIGSGAYLMDCAATLTTCKQLERVVRDFMETARTYGRVIISETHLPPEAKTIRPLGLGGVLGGEKYVVRGVMFKTPNTSAELFARFGDTQYRDSAYIAHKVQGHEMKGLKAYFGWFFNRGTLGSVSFPLTAVIDFKGHRITAMTILPISKNTLIYGSDNAGDLCTVKNEMPEWSKLIREASIGLRLKPHWVKNGSGEFEMASCVDLEGHKGRDGRMYLLDFSRTLPPAYKNPTTPPINDRCWPFYHMLRQEFVAKYGAHTPLSADAWSTFASTLTAERKAEEKKINQDIKAATEHLMTVTVNEVVADLISPSSTSLSLSHIFHRAGLNMRYLGRVYAELKELLKGQERRNPALKNLLYSVQLEALVRVLKNYLRAQLRLTQENARGQDCEAELLRVTAQVLNNFFAYSINKSTWMGKNPFVLPMLEISFGLSGKDAERAVDTFLTDFGVDRFGTTMMETRSFKYEVLERLNQAAGLGLNKLLMDDLRSPATNVRGRSFRRERLFDELLDISFTERVKHLDVVERSRALSCYLLGTQALAASPPQPSEAEEHFFAAFEVLRYSLSASPKDPWLCALMADTCSAIWALVKCKLGEAESADEMLETSKLVNLFADRAESYFTQALQIDSLSVFVLRRYGNFLQQRGQLERAEEQLLKCVHIRDHQEHALDEQAVRELVRLLDAKKDAKLATQLRQKLVRLTGRPEPAPLDATSPRTLRVPTEDGATTPTTSVVLGGSRNVVRVPGGTRAHGSSSSAPSSSSAADTDASPSSGDSLETSTGSGSKSPRKMLIKLFSSSCDKPRGGTAGRDTSASDSSVDVSAPTLVSHSSSASANVSGSSTPLSRDSGSSVVEAPTPDRKPQRPPPRVSPRVNPTGNVSGALNEQAPPPRMSPRVTPSGSLGGGPNESPPPHRAPPSPPATNQSPPDDADALQQRRTTMRVHLENMYMPGSGKH